MNISYLHFLAGAMIISLSGVMAPGPMSTVIVGKGGESPHAGAFVALGHGIVEFPLMLAIFFGFGFLFNLPYVKPFIGIAGSIFLLYMSVSMFRSLRLGTAGEIEDRHSPIVSGIVLSTMNPYFLIWWATVGATMVMQSATYGIVGLFVFMVCHWLCDLGWSWFLSILSFKGGQFFGKNFQKVIFAVSGVLLVVFSGKFMYDAAQSILG